jgi:hypothetical protein
MKIFFANFLVSDARCPDTGTDRRFFKGKNEKNNFILNKNTHIILGIKKVKKAK